MPKTPEEIHAELRERAIAEEENTVHPGEPTLTGWLRAMLQEIISLRVAAEERAETEKRT